MKIVLFVATLLALSGCATMSPDPDIPEGADRSVRTEDNGDVIEEYRVAGQLRIVKVTPPRGPAYYLIDDNGDGRMDRGKGEVKPVYYKLYGW